MPSPGFNCFRENNFQNWSSAQHINATVALLLAALSIHFPEHRDGVGLSVDRPWCGLSRSEG